MIDDNSDDFKIQNIQNTFAPHVENKMLSLSMIMTGLKTCTLHYDKLPKHVQERVDAYIARKRRGKLPN